MRCPTCLDNPESKYSDGTLILDHFGDQTLHGKGGNALRTALWHGPVVQMSSLAARLAELPAVAGPANAMLTSNKRPDVTVAQAGCKRVITDVNTCSAILNRNSYGATSAPRQ